MSSILFSSDASVQGTNDDAQVSKMSCCKLGYFKDDFISLFVRRSTRRSPLINRGYYSRHSALRQLLMSFLKTAHAAGSESQVLSLGAGFDTTWFQLNQDSPELLPTRYLEVDFPEVTKRKASIVATQPKLKDGFRTASVVVQGAPPPASSSHPPPSSSSPSAAAAPAPPPPSEQLPAGPSSSDAPLDASSSGNTTTIRADVGEIISHNYCLLPVNLQDQAALAAAIARAGLKLDVPTYVLSECVLVYMDPEDSKAVVGFAGRHFSSAAMVIYEQVKPHDAFGRQMCTNLEGRGCPLRGVHATPTPEAHCMRMRDNGWAAATCHDMDTIYLRFLDPADKARIERLELFDEFEEWHMIQEHYSITVAVNDATGLLKDFGFHDQAPLPAPGLPAFSGRPLPCAD